MQAVMARIRITIDCEEAVKRAFLSRASIEGKSPQQFFEWMVGELCQEDLTRAKLRLDGVAIPDDATLRVAAIASCRTNS